MHRDETWPRSFEAHRTRLRAVAYRMLGSVSEADDARAGGVAAPEPRGRTSGSRTSGGWLTTVVARVSPEHAAHAAVAARGAARGARARADREPRGRRRPRVRGAARRLVGLALLRGARHARARRAPRVRACHDMFAVPFDEIAPMVGRTPAAARQLASRGRRRVQGAATEPDADLAPPARRSSTRSSPPPATATSTRSSPCSIPTSVLRSDGGPGRPGATVEVHGAATVAGRALMFAGLRRTSGRRSSTAPPASWSRRADGPMP